MHGKVLPNKWHKVFAITTAIFVFLITTHAQEQAMEERLNEFIYSDEFKAPEIDTLKSLPKEAVVTLSIFLNKKNIGEADELRIFQCLAIKYIQCEDKLSKDEQDIATEALLRKLRSTNKADFAFRANILKNVKAPEILGEIHGETPKTHSKPNPTDESQASTTSPTSAEQDSKSAEAERPSSSMKWPLATTVGVVGLGLLWAVLKLRK